ncbi:MAG: anti-sigma factor [Gemmatimonadetes bacterium]|nr:anti-sigma factor [Gemmatimonadota bacterium]
MSDDAKRPDEMDENAPMPDIAEAELGMLLAPAPAPEGDATRARLLARAAADNTARGLKRAARLDTPVPEQAMPVIAGASSRPSLTNEVIREAPRPPRSSALVMPRWAMALAMVVPAAAILLMIQTRDELETTKATFASSDRMRARQLDSLTARLAERDAQVAALTGERVSVVDMADARTLAPMGRMFWDQATNRWTFTAHHLPPLAQGRIYQLWLVVAGQKISAGTFAPDPSGSAQVRQVYEVKPGTLQAVAVTEEPMGGVRQPTGPMVVLGKAAQ